MHGNRDYVLGFLFTENMDEVVLIKKTKPDWQKGFLNGVGGKIEEYDKSPRWAMVREFQEETGVTDIEDDEWILFAEMIIENGNDPDPNVHQSKIYCYYASPVEKRQVKSITEEEVRWCPTKSIGELKTVPNLKWLIPMIINHDSNNVAFTIAKIYYS